MSMPWTPEEIAQLEYAAPKGMRAIRRTLGGRSPEGIRLKAKKIGVAIRRSTVEVDVSTRCDPVVKALFDALFDRSMSVAECGEASVGRDTLNSWRRGHDPKIKALRRALNAAGLDLAVVPIKREGTGPPN
jgi:hypothetical protein